MCGVETFEASSVSEKNVLPAVFLIVVDFKKAKREFIADLLAKKNAKNVNLEDYLKIIADYDLQSASKLLKDVANIEAQMANRICSGKNSSNFLFKIF